MPRDSLLGAVPERARLVHARLVALGLTEKRFYRRDLESAVAAFYGCSLSSAWQTTEGGEPLGLWDILSRQSGRRTLMKVRAPAPSFQEELVQDGDGLGESGGLLLS